MTSNYAVEDNFKAFTRAEEIHRTINEARADKALIPAEDVFDKLERKYNAMIEREAN